MQTLRLLFEEISTDKNRWSYYKNPDFDIKGKWDSKSAAMSFITSYFDYAGKSQCFKDQHLDSNHQFVEDRAAHIISTFLIGIKLFESFHIETESRDENNMNLKYYWFLTCLYHDIGYAFEKGSTCEQLRMLQVDGLDALQEIADIKYLHEREFKSFSKEEVDLYLKGRAYCDNGQRGCIDHGIVGGLLLYDKLRKQFEISWNRRTDKSNSRESFNIKDEFHDRELHLSNKHYEAYAKAADAIMIHNIWLETFNDYVDKYDAQHRLRKHIESEDRISPENELCFILAIADTLEPLKKKLTLDDISIKLPSTGLGITIELDEICYRNIYESSINQLKKWVAVDVSPSLLNRKATFTLSPLSKF